MLRWQRSLRIALGVFLVGLIAVIALSLRSRTPQSAGPPTRIDPGAAVELPQGADIVWTEKGREVFTLKFKRALSYADGRSVFSGADVRIPARDGKLLRVTADDAEVRTPTGQPRNVFMRGNVVLSSEDGLELKTATARYAEDDRVLRIPGAFTFTRGRTSGSGFAATYDQNSEVFTIRDEARVKVAPDETGAEALDIASRAATLDRRQHIARFEGNATVVRGTHTTSADTLVAFLTPDEQRLTRVELRGASKVSDATAAPGALRGMEAQDIDLTYAEDGRTLQRANLRGQAAMEIASSTAAPRRLAADTIDVAVGADGSTLQQLNAQQRVSLDLPAEAEAPARRVQSNSLTGAGGTDGLRDVVFSGSVEYRETRAASGKTPAMDRLARSDRLDATLAPGFGAPETAVFRGRANLLDGATTAEEGVVNYRPARGGMTLETPPGTAGATPRVADDQVTVSATWIELTLDPRKLHAKGDVRSILTQKTEGRRQKAEEDGRQKTTGPGTTRRPVMLNGQEPINVTAKELQYDGTTSSGTYTGGARLWQGETTLQGDTLVLDEKSGNLTAERQVRTRMMLEDTDTKTKQKKLVESLGSADHFAYDDAARRATYTGAAHLTGPQGDVTAKKIELFLNDDGRTLNRAEAYDDVVARLEGGQRAWGTRLTYFGADERYVMTGTPVKILETVEGGCRETVGASLTFIRSTDTISVVGTEGNRSRTLPGRCVER